MQHDLMMMLFYVAMAENCVSCSVRAGPASPPEKWQRLRKSGNTRATENKIYSRQGNGASTRWWQAETREVMRPCPWRRWGCGGVGGRALQSVAEERKRQEGGGQRRRGVPQKGGGGELRGGGGSGRGGGSGLGSKLSVEPEGTTSRLAKRAFSITTAKRKPFQTDTQEKVTAKQGLCSKRRTHRLTAASFPPPRIPATQPGFAPLAPPGPTRCHPQPLHPPTYPPTLTLPFSQGTCTRCIPRARQRCLSRPAVPF